MNLKSSKTPDIPSPLPQLVTAAAFVGSTEAKLRVHGEYIKELEASLAAEQLRVKQLLGGDLAALGPPALQQLARIHEDGLRRVRALQVSVQGTLHSIQVGGREVEDNNCLVEVILMCRGGGGRGGGSALQQLR